MTNKSNSRKALKAGVWYTICNIVDRGIAFFTVPIFTRLLTKSQVGDFSNFTVWMMILSYIVTMDMHVTVSRARFDYKEKLNQYLSSTAVLGVVITFIGYGVTFLFRSQISNILGLDFGMISIMMLGIMFSNAYQLYLVNERVHYRYKTASLLTLGVNLVTTICSIVLVLTFSDRLLGRVYGYVIPKTIVYFVIFLILVYKGRCINFQHWKYCLKIALPYIPHLLSIYLLSASDRAMIKIFCGSEDLALYSLGYTCSALVSLVERSMNQAWAPWLTEQLYENNYSLTRKISKAYLGFFTLIIIAVGLIVPELVLFMGGSSYKDSIFVLPPVIIGCLFQFVYTMYVTIETYEKKTGTMAIATSVGAISNVILNYIFIPRYGYIAAAFTTLVGYMILFLLHFLAVRKLGMSKVYDSKYIFGILGLSLIVIAVLYVLYHINIVRWIVISLIVLICFIVYVIKRDEINPIIRRFIKR